MNDGSDHALTRFWSRVRLGALLPYVILGVLLVVAVGISRMARKAVQEAVADLGVEQLGPDGGKREWAPT